MPPYALQVAVDYKCQVMISISWLLRRSFHTVWMSSLLRTFYWFLFGIFGSNSFLSRITLALSLSAASSNIAVADITSRYSILHPVPGMGCMLFSYCLLNSPSYTSTHTETPHRAESFATIASQTVALMIKMGIVVAISTVGSSQWF